MDINFERQLIRYDEHDLVSIPLPPGAQNPVPLERIVEVLDAANEANRRQQDFDPSDYYNGARKQEAIARHYEAQETIGRAIRLLTRFLPETTGVADEAADFLKSQSK